MNNHNVKNSLDAIAEIHKVLDDDQNGAVDSLESEDVSKSFFSNSCFELSSQLCRCFIIK